MCLSRSGVANSVAPSSPTKGVEACVLHMPCVGTLHQTCLLSVPSQFDVLGVGTCRCVDMQKGNGCVGPGVSLLSGRLGERMLYTCCQAHLHSFDPQPTLVATAATSWGTSTSLCVVLLFHSSVIILCVPTHIMGSSCVGVVWLPSQSLGQLSHGVSGMPTACISNAATCRGQSCLAVFCRTDIIT